MLLEGLFGPPRVERSAYGCQEMGRSPPVEVNCALVRSAGALSFIRRTEFLARRA
jgi:hypothetical protein